MIPFDQARAIRRKLKSGKPTFGTWLTFSDPSVGEILAGAGFDWIVIDMEHSPLTLSQAQEQIRAISLCGACPLVRLPDNDPILVKRVMDAGAGGIVVPMVNAAEEAERAVASVRYPPRGIRSVGLARAQGYGTRFAENFRESSDALIVVQIEHEKAARNIDAILAVEGIDAFFIGPYDLSASLGIPGKFDDPRQKAAIAKVLAAGRAAGVPSGVHVVHASPKEARARVREGFLFIAYGVDFLHLGDSARAGVAAASVPDAKTIPKRVRDGGPAGQGAARRRGA